MSLYNDNCKKYPWSLGKRKTKDFEIVISPVSLNLKCCMVYSNHVTWLSWYRSTSRNLKSTSSSSRSDVYLSRIHIWSSLLEIKPSLFMSICGASNLCHNLNIEINGFYLRNVNKISQWLCIIRYDFSLHYFGQSV